MHIYIYTYTYIYIYIYIHTYIYIYIYVYTLKLKHYAAGCGPQGASAVVVGCFKVVCCQQSWLPYSAL